MAKRRTKKVVATKLEKKTPEIVEKVIEDVKPSVFSEDELTILDRLSKVTSATPQDKELIAQMYKKFIDGTVHVCVSCDEPIRLAYKRVMAFYKDNV